MIGSRGFGDAKSGRSNVLRDSPREGLAQKTHELEVFCDIGAPGFEPGTSPTRTVRATRLRHAPTRPPVSHTRRYRRLPCPPRSLTSSPSSTDCSSRSASRTTASTACRFPGPARSQTIGRGRLRARRAVRAGRGRARGAAARPPRALLGLGPRTDRRDCSSAACRSCSTPTSRSPRTTCRSTRTPSSATTRCSRARSAPSSSSRSRCTAGQPIGFIAHLPGDGTGRAGAVRARARAHRARAARVRRRARSACAAWRSSRARAPTTSPRRAAAGADALLTGEPLRARDGAGARGAACT